ncbi:MAG TPA: PAS domain-containing protein [Chthonomonadaceae bacterium]|nr:PAS domain-containing protein [Chthonomonadaceae bacterium]
MAMRTISTTVPILAEVADGDYQTDTPAGCPMAISEAQVSTTLALTMAPPDCIVQPTALEKTSQLREQLAQEQAAHALQRANAEQARRVADCLRACHTTLLHHLQQPCFQLDRDGNITHWNAALERWTGLASSQAIGKSLAACFPASLCTLITDAMRLSLAAAETQESTTSVLTLRGPLRLLPGRTAAELSLVPLYRVPGVIEAFVVLMVVA